jgi:hypothetical protein
MKNKFSLAFVATVFMYLVSACESDVPMHSYIMNYWRPISDPNVFLNSAQAGQKLNFDVSQCKCSNYPINVPHNEIGVIVPDQARLYETSATRFDVGRSCSTSPDAVLVECMRARGWEPTSCSGRVGTNGTSTQCATTILTLPAYPDEYPYRGPLDTSYYGSSYPYGLHSPAETRKRYP